MGNTDSIPVVSQAKSLVQVIGGDAKGAKKTQENFARTAPVVSQFNSLGHSIAGNNDEARKIQEEFGSEMQSLAEGTPVVGHFVSAGYAIAGDTKKAEQVALGATKSTVVAVAGIAGAACGPGAPACGAALATSANAGWDGLDSVIGGESRGMIKGFQDIHEGKASIGSAFDTIAEQGLVAGGGALGAYGARKTFSNFKKKIGGYKKICRRSTDEFVVFNNNLSDLPEFANKTLPGSFHDLETVQWNNVNHGINAIISIFLMIKMFIIGHPKSKVYFEEVCHQIYPSQPLQECEQQIYLALQKYNQDDSFPDNDDPFNDSLNALVFEMNQILGNTTVGYGLLNSMCMSQQPTNAQTEGLQAMFVKCKEKVEASLIKLKAVFDLWDSKVSKIRVRRCTPVVKYVKFSRDFRINHVLDDFNFNKYLTKQLTDGDADFLYNYRQAGPPSNLNTIIKSSDAAKLWDIASETTYKDYSFSTKPVDIIQVDTFTGEIWRGRGLVRYMIDPKNGNIFHMGNPIWVDTYQG